ncbi:hypothetical protein BASA81_014514 [Batrachochytrium salamandrivorans]|nr:hypothetical protein BASA81_014514 [Batrachochytrium salamandrivorans]
MEEMSNKGVWHYIQMTMYLKEFQDLNIVQSLQYFDQCDKGAFVRSLWLSHHNNVKYTFALAMLEKLGSVVSVSVMGWIGELWTLTLQDAFRNWFRTFVSPDRSKIDEYLYLLSLLVKSPYGVLQDSSEFIEIFSHMPLSLDCGFSLSFPRTTCLLGYPLEAKQLRNLVQADEASSLLVATIKSDRIEQAFMLLTLYCSHHKLEGLIKEKAERDTIPVDLSMLQYYVETHQEELGSDADLIVELVRASKNGVYESDEADMDDLTREDDQPKTQ